MPVTKQKFSDGEKVLCFHGPLLYEAKVNKVQVKDKIPTFLIHYSGWSKSWDEWVPESRVLKLNDINLQKQKELQQQYPNEKQKRAVKKKSDKKREADTPIQTRRKRARQDQLECSTREASPLHPEIKITLSDELKKWLVDDWDLVTRQKQLVRLPKQNSVKRILQQYQHHTAETEPETFKRGELEEVCEGLKDYFDAMLGTQLLYKFERPQYSDMLEKFQDKTAADIYGVEHLLRLFVRLGSMLMYTPMDDDCQSLIKTHIQRFVKYLEESPELFVMEYDAAPPEYHRRLA